VNAEDTRLGRFPSPVLAGEDEPEARELRRGVESLLGLSDPPSPQSFDGPGVPSQRPLRGIGLAVLLDDDAPPDLGDGADDPEAATLQVEFGPAKAERDGGLHPNGARRRSPPRRTLPTSGTGGVTVTLGPIEIVVLGFPGNRFTGEIRPRIVDLVQRDIVTVIDALFITKDVDGTVGFLELEQLVDDPEISALSELLSSRLDLLASEDADELATELEPGSSALALVFEHRWMVPVREAVIESGGLLLADLHVPPEVVESVLAAAE
jgi:hypothetical protein